jgi:F0F1-type ATP synthase assembly protein I
MLTPQFSVRQLLLLVALSAMVCLVPALAAQGRQWAIALSAALFGGMALLVIGGLLTVATRTLGAAFGRRRTRTSDGGSKA